MKINKDYTLSFRAKLVSTKKIGKLVDKTYVQSPVSFVKIEPENVKILMH